MTNGAGSVAGEQPAGAPEVRGRASARGAKRRPAWARRTETVAVAVALAVVVWFFHATVAANSGFEDWGDIDYFKLLVRGWKKGQLHLDKEPAPELLALADPYDPAQNGPYKLGDATLYKGKYYIYFGPAPALTLMLPYALLTGREMTMGAATFVFATLAFLTASGLWLAIRRRYFPESTALMAPLGVLALGTGTHLLALAQRPMIWELPIAAGIAFSLLAASAASAALHGRRPALAMAAAGLCLGLAVASRPICLVAGGVLLPPVWLAWRERGADGRRWLRLALAGLAPLVACGLAIMAHNYARFGNPLEWGQNYQLSGAYEGKLVHFSPRFFLHNAGVYFFQLLRWSAEFPFARAVGIEIDHIRDYFGTEEVAGLAVTFPFVWFAAALPLALRGRDAEERRRLGAVLATLLAYTVPVMAVVLSYFSTTTRYQADFAVGLGLLALVGLLALERSAQRRATAWPRRVVTAVGMGVMMATTGVGVLMSFDYHGRSMHITAPARWEALDRAAHERLTALGCALGRVDGPQVLKVRFRQQPVGTVEPFWEPADPAAGERIAVEHIGEGLIRFGYARGTDAPTWGRPLRWEKDHSHTVSVQMSSLYPEFRDEGWAATQRRVAFRQRTSVAVWFSGGRALGLTVERRAANGPAGGAVARGFSGEVRGRFTRGYRSDEVESGWTDPWAKRGGVLRMRIVFPEALQPEGEPILVTGAHYRSSMVFAEAAEDGAVRLTFESTTLPRVHSAAFRPRASGHALELEMPTFAPEAFGVEATGEVVVRLDGVEILRSRQLAYWFPAGSEALGRNPFGTTSAAEFRGWILDAGWWR